MNRILIVFVTAAIVASTAGCRSSRSKTTPKPKPAAKPAVPTYHVNAEPEGAKIWVSTKRDSGYIAVPDTKSGKQLRTPGWVKFNWDGYSGSQALYFMAQWEDGIQSAPQSVSRGQQTTRLRFRRPVAKVPPPGVEDTPRPKD